ncbi:transcriptional regulator, partial [bacterium]
MRGVRGKRVPASRRGSGPAIGVAILLVAAVGAAAVVRPARQPAHAAPGAT